VAADAARKTFDAATAFLIMNFVPDDGRRLETLREIHARLKPGARFLMIDLHRQEFGSLRGRPAGICRLRATQWSAD
jgi:SAM-dependent methyltransferase